MMASRTIKAVKAHIPLIKFPNRKVPNAKHITLTAESSASAAAAAAVVISPSPAAASSPSKAIGLSPRGSGIEPTDLPSRYHRKVLSTEEIDYIEHGGPS